MMSIKKTWHILKADCKRFNKMQDDTPARLTGLRFMSLLLRPEMMAMLLYRLGHYFYEHDRFFLAQFLHNLSILATGADIHPASRIGAGCLIVHTVGTVIHGTIGENVIIFAHVVIVGNGGYVSLSDCPIVGDDVTLASMVTLEGAIILANNITVAPYSLITESVVQENAMVSRVPGEDVVVRTFTRSGKNASV